MIAFLNSYLEMEILNNSDLMSEIIDYLDIDDLRNLFFSFYWIDRRWISKTKYKKMYDNRIYALKERFRNAVRKVNRMYWSFARYNHEMFLLRHIMLKLTVPKYLTIKNPINSDSDSDSDCDPELDPDFEFTISKIIKNEFTAIELKIYDRTITHKSFNFDDDD